MTLQAKKIVLRIPRGLTGAIRDQRKLVFFLLFSHERNNNWSVCCSAKVEYTYHLLVSFWLTHVRWCIWIAELELERDALRGKGKGVKSTFRFRSGIFRAAFEKFLLIFKRSFGFSDWYIRLKQRIFPPENSTRRKYFINFKTILWLNWWRWKRIGLILSVDRDKWVIRWTKFRFRWNRRRRLCGLKNQFEKRDIRFLHLLWEKFHSIGLRMLGRSDREKIVDEKEQEVKQPHLFLVVWEYRTLDCWSK